MNSAKRLLQVLVLVAVSVLLLSCEAVGYYSQAARGQLAIVFSRQDIQRLLSDEELSSETRVKFEAVLQIREFAARELHLPVGEHFSTFVDIEREHVVWNVFAAPEFSLDPVSWCYPIAGCVSYRGYFAESGAERFAARLREQGYDVYTGGVDAYSTLGWFEDSLLSTVLRRQPYQLAGLIFHELAHQVVYVPGDTGFNESFATAVEREGMRRWLQTTGQEELLQSAEQFTEQQRQFNALVSGYQERFEALYAKEIPVDQMRRDKDSLQEALRADYQQLKAEWGGYTGYDNWFGRSLNNAQLSTVSIYNDYVPFFDRLLQEVGGDFSEFYRRVEVIAALDEAEREALLTQ